jgi:hypothetical protein
VKCAQYIHNAVALGALLQRFGLRHFISRKRRILIAILTIVTLLIWLRWDSLRYRGDGSFSDALLFHPRYVIAFSEIPLNEPSEHHFRFRGLPNEKLTLVLYVKNRNVNTLEERSPLENLQATIEATLTDERGNVACSATGRPAPANRDGIWVLMSGGATGYWHYRCHSVQVHRNKIYNLMIKVSNVDPRIERVVITPTLEGGGWEMI